MCSLLCAEHGSNAEPCWNRPTQCRPRQKASSCTKLARTAALSVSPHGHSPTTDLSCRPSQTPVMPVSFSHQLLNCIMADEVWYTGSLHNFSKKNSQDAMSST